MAGIPSEEIYLSVLTVGELRKGIESIRRRDSAAARALEAWLGKLISAHADRILEIDREIAERWGQLNVPHDLKVVDSLLAATALVRGLTLVTRNLKDVELTGVDCFNPFSTGL